MLLREGIVRLLAESDLEVVGQAGDAEDLLRKVGAHKPDVVIADIRMPPDNTDDGLRAAIEIRDRHPGTGVLVLSAYVEEAYALELVSDDARGSGTCSRTGSPTSTASSTRCAGSGGAARRSIPRLSRGCSDGPRAPTRSPSSRTASARCSS